MNTSVSPTSFVTAGYVVDGEFTKIYRKGG